MSAQRQPCSSLGAEKILQNSGFNFKLIFNKEVLCSACNVSCVDWSRKSKWFRNTNLAVGPCTDRRERCSDMSYPALCAGDSPGNDGNPRCLPRTVARMRTNTVGSSLDSVGLPAVVSCAPRLFQRGNHNLSFGKGFPSAEGQNPRSSLQRGNSSGSTGEHGRGVLQALLPPLKEKRGITSYPGSAAVEQAPQTFQV